MIYEVYPDLLLLEVFVWNYCSLSIINECFIRSAGTKRIMLGTVLETIVFLCVYFAPLPVVLRRILKIIGTILVLWGTFPVNRFRKLLKIMEYYWIAEALIGCVVIMIQKIPGLNIFSGAGGTILCIIVTMLTKIQRRSSLKRNGNKRCRAVLIKGVKRIEVEALADTGNCLREPVSGKPVCVLEGEEASRLWDSSDLFRVVPYHSVGKTKGILKSYLLPELWIEGEGPVRKFRKVYIAIAPIRREIHKKPSVLKVKPDAK